MSAPDEKVTVSRADVNALAAALQFYIESAGAAAAAFRVMSGAEQRLGVAWQDFTSKLAPVPEAPEEPK